MFSDLAEVQYEHIQKQMGRKRTRTCGHHIACTDYRNVYYYQDYVGTVRNLLGTCLENSSLLKDNNYQEGWII